MNDKLEPKDHAERVALFRAQVIGPILCKGLLDYGELAAHLRDLSKKLVMPPGAKVQRTYAPATLERWLYSYRKGGLPALKPKRRSDRGFAQALSEPQRQLFLSIRRDHPTASASLILRTLTHEGRLPENLLSEGTLRRLYLEHGLERALPSKHEKDRKRWQAEAPNVLWHSDVCHGPALRANGRAVPLRIHAILDDRSRYVVAIQACATERESEMLALVVKAVRAHGLCQVLYLDRGSTYRGQALQTACARLGVTLLYAKPKDPQARGKMERFWRTLREQCLDHLGEMSCLHDVQVRLLAWLDKHYLVTPHSALMGRSPLQVYESELGQPKEVSELMLKEALTVRGRRRIRHDGTVMVAGRVFELEQGFLSGRVVTVARSFLDPTQSPWVEHEEQCLRLYPVDPVANSLKPRYRRARRGLDAIPFDPPGALLRKLLEGGEG